ncbi:MAG: hypothetical protein H0T50_11530, partial [Gemmatimonadales bacterium]|nr:hypothetical protein [Gemmatimonadales bacterium]
MTPSSVPPPGDQKASSSVSPSTVHPSRSYDPDLLRATEFPWTTDTIYLNNASIGPLPERTRLVLDEFNRG